MHFAHRAGVRSIGPSSRSCPIAPLLPSRDAVLLEYLERGERPYHGRGTADSSFFLKPFQRPWRESELLFCFLVRSPAQLRRVINRIRPGGLQRLLLADVRRRRSTDKTREGRQPDSQRDGVVVDDVVGAGQDF